MQSFAALNKLVSVGHIFVIRGNGPANLDGLENLESAKMLSIKGNYLLTDCCGVYPIIATGGAKSYNIRSNGGGDCESVLDIIDNCAPMLLGVNAGANSSTAALPAQKIPEEDFYLETEEDDWQVSERRIDLYPNPAFDVVDVAWRNFGDRKIRLIVYNKLGQPVLSKQIEGAKIWSARLNVSDLPGGAYFVEVRSGGEQFIEKLMIMR